MKNIKVRTKILVGYICVILLTISVGVVGIVSTSNLQSKNVDLYENRISPLGDIYKIIYICQQIRILGREAIIGAGDTEKSAALRDEINDLILELNEVISKCANTITDPQTLSVFSVAEKQCTEIFLPGMRQFIETAVYETDRDVLVATMRSLTGSVQEMVDNLDECVSLQISTSEKIAHSSGESAKSNYIIICCAIVLSIIVALFFSHYLSKLIAVPIGTMRDFFVRFCSFGDLELSNEDRENIKEQSAAKDEIGQCITSAVQLVGRIITINDSLSQVAQGDFTATIDELSEKDALGRAFNKMTSSVKEMFVEIGSASKQLSAGAAQISNISQELATGSVQQASSIEEFSASLSELQKRTDENAKNSVMAEQVSTKSGEMLMQSSQSMSRALDAMKEIEESSSSIIKVVKVIDELAFQTNILALNASVEAAREGQHGKGFSVVADEVRNLATKSAQAARETAVLIEKSSNKVAEGNELLTEAGESLEQVAQSAKKAVSLVQGTAIASVEQAGFIENMTKNIHQISGVVQANSASAQQSAAAAEEIAAQSEMLNDVMVRFKTN